eukprot:PhF_6_TR29285/c0_g1_i1/m.42911/K15463/RIT1; tRNA A64-2'-O-ribosylphosphate transferase
MKKVRQDESNILHRLRSILEDSDFVQSIQNAYLSKSYPTFANLRCGAWYSPCFDGECYFKSTDGHYGTWDCNFSRLNLHMFKSAAECGGAVVVDSTRKGKIFPDSLSKTLPIIAMVLNVAVAGVAVGDVENLPLFLSQSERQSILDKILSFATALQKSSIQLEDLRKIMNGRVFKCCWVNRTSPDVDTRNDQWIPLILVSASDNLMEDSEAIIDVARSGACYVPGAADDEESWSRGLTAKLFWENYRKILPNTTISVIEVIERVDEIVATAKSQQQSSSSDSVHVVALLPASKVLVVTSLELSKCENFPRSVVILCNEESSNRPIGCHLVHTFESSHVFIFEFTIRMDSKFDFERSLPALFSAMESLKESWDQVMVVEHEPALAFIVAVALTIRWFCLPERKSNLNKSIVGDMYNVVASQLPHIRQCRNLKKQLNRFFLTPNGTAD